MKKHRRLSKSEMAAYIFLLSTLLATLVIYSYREEIFGSSTSVRTLSESETREMEVFAQQIKEDSIRRARTYQKKTWRPKALTPFAFDPNTADSATLARLGLKSWQISNLLKYRRKGGKWKTADDFSKLYGLNEKDFKTLRPYIRIKYKEVDKTPVKSKIQKDSLLKKYPEKYEAGTILQLNEADTTELKRIPGIGSYYASKICRYREKLGGFVSVDQIKEIEGLPKGIEQWFAVSDSAKIRKTHINKADFKQLVRHPYLSYEQVKYICNYIRKYGKIQSLSDLSNSELFSAADLQRLVPYISFE